MWRPDKTRKRGAGDATKCSKKEWRDWETLDPFKRGKQKHKHAIVKKKEASGILLYKAGFALLKTQSAKEKPAEGLTWCSPEELVTRLQCISRNSPQVRC